jgi:glycosyltransferase involved in cell wall biosynthesis
MHANTSPLVSVIIPTWNRKDIVTAAIHSVLRQSYKNIEILVCDDGSFDDTFKRVSAIDDSRIKWVPGKHVGLPAAPRNAGLKIASGEWIAFLDSDDIWHEKKLETQLRALQNAAQPTLASCSNAERRISPQEITGLLLAIPATDTRITRAQLFKTNFVITSSALFHRSLLREAAGFPINVNLKVGEDYAFWLRIATSTDFIFHADPLLVYSDTPQTSVRGFKRNETIAKLHVLLNYFKWYVKVDPLKCAILFTKVMCAEMILGGKLLYWQLSRLIGTGK